MKKRISRIQQKRISQIQQEWAIASDDDDAHYILFKDAYTMIFDFATTFKTIATKKGIGVMINPAVASKKKGAFAEKQGLINYWGYDTATSKITSAFSIDFKIDDTKEPFPVWDENIIFNQTISPFKINEADTSSIDKLTKWLKKPLALSGSHTPIEAIDTNINGYQFKKIINKQLSGSVRKPLGLIHKKQIQKVLKSPAVGLRIYLGYKDDITLINKIRMIIFGVGADNRNLIDEAATDPKTAKYAILDKAWP